MTERTPLQKAAAVLQMNEHTAAMMRDHWQQSPESALIKEALFQSLETIQSESRQKLISCSKSELKGLQERIKALILAQSMIREPIK